MASAFEAWGRNIIASTVDQLTPSRRITADELGKAFREKRIRRVLFLRAHQGLGDLLLATPTFRALKQADPSIEIDFVAAEYNHLVVDNNPYLSNIWILEKHAMGSPRRLLRFLGNLRRRRYDLAIPLTSNAPSFTSYLLARLSGARSVVGVDTRAFYSEADWSRPLTHLELKTPDPATPEIQKFLEHIRFLGVQPKSLMTDFVVPPSLVTWAAQEWERYEVPVSHARVGIFLGGNPDRPDRLWPSDRWTALMERLRCETDVTVIAITPPDQLRSGSGALEEGIYKLVAPGLGGPVQTFSNRDLHHVAAFVRGLDLFICPDGGLFHIAMTQAPTVVLFFASDPNGWIPPVPHVRALRPSDGRPESLSTLTVFEAAQALLAARQSYPDLPVDLRRPIYQNRSLC